MKNLTISLLTIMIASSITIYGQTSARKNNFSFGFGKQAYNGDLGNSWFNLEEEWYGLGTISYSRYLNKSFDFSGSLTTGDFGHCREDDESEFRPDGSQVLNMLGRLTSVVVSGKYKFANGYLLKENAKLAPYVYLGMGFNNISEFWWNNKTRANTGYYSSINGGLGLRFNLNEKFNLTYNFGIGSFTSDNIDFRIEGKKDMVMQNTLMFGINF